MRKASLMDVGGWEAFLHGVFAIAITLLVLDIHVPPVESTPNAKALVDALLDGMPHYVAYVLGFLYLGTYWIATHRTLRLLRGVDHWFLVIGLVFLMVVSVLPFGTALLAEYIGQDQVSRPGGARALHVVAVAARGDCRTSRSTTRRGTTGFSSPARPTPRSGDSDGWPRWDP